MKSMKVLNGFYPVLVSFLFLAVPAFAGDADYTLVIQDHRFSPETLTIPAGKKVKILIDNQDPTAEEFESYSLNREKVIGGHKQGVIFVGPLKPGKYPFFGEFNQKTAQGVLVAEAV